MNYRKVSIKEELPMVGKFVTTIDEAGEHRVYRLNNDATWFMRDSDGINSPNNNLPITHWLKPEFSQDEIKYLESKYWFAESIDKTSFTRKSIHDNHSDAYSLRISENGDIVYWSMTPVNVDCDSGKSDTETITRKYKTFEDFKSNKHYDEVRNVH